MICLKWRFIGVTLCALSSVLSFAEIAYQNAAQVVHQSEAQAVIASSARLFIRADDLEQEAIEVIKQGNTLRKDIHRRRQQLMKLPHGLARQSLAKTIQNQVQNSLELSRLGSALREQSKQLRVEATQLLESGLAAEYPQWVKNPKPLSVHDTYIHAPQYIRAHNTQTRSVHPSMNELRPNPEIRQQGDMSLELIEQAGQQLPEGLDIGTFKISRDRKYFAHIEVEEDRENSSADTVIINQLQNWQLLLTDLNGKPVSNAEITFTGHMPGHVHGLPTQPRVTAEIMPGVYRISGVKFQMRGWWVIDLLVGTQLSKEMKKNADNIRFNLYL